MNTIAAAIGYTSLFMVGAIIGHSACAWAIKTWRCRKGYRPEPGRPTAHEPTRAQRRGGTCDDHTARARVGRPPRSLVWPQRFESMDELAEDLTFEGMLMLKQERQL